MSLEFDYRIDCDYITELIRRVYNPNDFNCIHVAKLLCDQFCNLVPYEVASFVHSGSIQVGGHVVCKIKDTELLLDPVGDYNFYHDLLSLKKYMLPWMYSRSTKSNLYLSYNHVPVVATESEYSVFNKINDEEDVLDLCNKLQHDHIRAIRLSDKSFTTITK